MGNGSDFVVAIAGDFTLARIRPLVERYLGSIPRGVSEQPRERGLPLVTKGERHEVDAGVVDRARTVIGFTGPFTLTNQNLNALGAVREVISRALSQRIREQMGGTYEVSVSLAVETVPPTRYTMTIDFESAPERMETLAAAAVDELERLHRVGPTDAQFQATREARVRDFDGRVEDNAYWVDELTFHAVHGWPLAGIGTHSREAEAMTLKDMRLACARYIPPNNYVRVTMRPRSAGGG